MAEYLVIRLGADPGEPAEWIAVDSDGTRIGAVGSGPLAEAAEAAQERPVLALLPGAEVLTTTVDIPVKGMSKLLAALPYALEEVIAEDVESLHFAAGARQSNGKTPVAAVSHERLRGWLEQLRDAGLNPVRVVPEQHGLATIPGTISLLIDGDQLLLNDGADTRLCLQEITPADALVAIGALEEQPQHEDDDPDTAEDGDAPAHLLVYCNEEDNDRYRHDWAALRSELQSVEVKLLPDGALPRLAATVASGNGINLLQGQYGAKTAYGGLFAPWKYAALLLLGLVLLGTATKAVNYLNLSRQEAALSEQFQAEYQQIMPGAQSVDDPVRLVASLRARAGAGDDTPQVLLQALEQLGRAAATAGDARIEAISYRSGVADVRINAANVSELDAIRQAVDQSGDFRARIQSTDQVGDRVNSRLQIQVIEQ